MRNDVYTHWRDSARVPRLFVVDARVALLLALTLFHPRWWTLISTLVVMVIFGILEYFKLTIPVALRLGRGYISGKRKLRGGA